MTIESLTKHKEALKKRTPKFIRQGARNITRLPKSWRRPRGFQSKMRKRKKGKPKRVSVGYKTPRALQGTLRSGLREKMVSNLSDLKTINSKTELAVLSSSVGKKKALGIIQEAKKLGVSFSNIQTEQKVKDIQDFLKSRKEIGMKKAEKKAKKEKKSVKKEEKPSKEEKKVEKPKTKNEESKKISKKEAKK